MEFTRGAFLKNAKTRASTLAPEGILPALRQPALAALFPSIHPEPATIVIL